LFAPFCFLSFRCREISHRPFFVSRGYLGLAAFRHILTDPRTQNIPLILETPSFEQPEEVWGTEIAVLQRISGAQQDLPRENCLEALVSEIKNAKHEAESKNPKRKKQDPSRSTRPKRRPVNKDEDEYEEEHE
jgi:AP endonuclease-1